MKHLSTFLIALAIAGCGTTATQSPTPPPEDPNLWLEEVESEKALDWVRAHNDKTVKTLSADPRFAQIEADAREILTAKDRIPMPELHNGRIYNFWQDADHVRGLWRRATTEEYEKEEPAWETVIDVDALAREEKENWVWKRATPLPPACDRWLVTLSRGGKDASVLREFDLPTRSFVKDGFSLPEAKSQVSWKDAD